MLTFLRLRQFIVLGALGLAGLAPIAVRADLTFVTGQTITALQLNNATDLRGFRFRNVSGTSVTITQLGRWVIAGNNQSHALSIYSDDAVPVQLATVTVNCSGAPTGQFLYGTLATPYVLPPGAYCWIVSAETSGGDTWYSNGGINLTMTNIGTITSGRITGGVPTNNNDNTRSYGPVSFRYSSPLPNFTKSGKVYTTDGSLYSVNSALADSSPGDTINVPAGTFTWGASDAYVNITKAVTVAGAGRGQTIINIAPDARTYASGTINVAAAATIRSMTINQAGADTTTAFVLGTTDGWRLTDITYNSAPIVGYFAFASTNGVIDNCTLNLGAGSDEPIFARGPTDAWQTPAGLGSVNAVFVEDCTFNAFGYVCDFNSNSHGVIRFCTITGTSKIDGHGLASNSPPRGVRSMEVYGNTWTATSNFWTAIEMRGGTGMIFDNTAAGSASNAWFYLTEYGYLGTWPNFGNTYQTPANYPIKDQIGVGADPKASGSEPFYVWNNVQNGAPWIRTLKTPAAGAIALHGSAFTERDMIQADRDFFASSGFDGTYTFDGSKGMGRGTKAEMMAIVPTKVGVGFWVTDEGSWNTTLPANTSGQLYAWNGAAWVLKYTPFTYPHPARRPLMPTTAVLSE